MGGGLAKSFVLAKDMGQSVRIQLSSVHDVKWFLGGKLNVTENYLDGHLKSQPKKTAIIFEPNDVNEPSIHISCEIFIVKCVKLQIC